MKYIFRGITVFEYIPDAVGDKVVQGKVHKDIPAFNHCRMIEDDYRLLGEFFQIVYKHLQGEEVELKDIKVQ